LQIGSSGDKGLLLVGERMFDTSGWLGLWTDSEGRTQQWATPGWATLPARYDLALARNWHLLFAWVMVLAWLVYVLHGWWRGHFRGDLGVRSDQLRPRALWLALRAHFGLTALRALATGEYNSLQRLSYLAVIFGLIPLMILTGLSMSPGVNAALPWLPELFGGRQSARSLHFLTMTGLLLFVVLHLVMVLLAGPFRLTRSMITGGVQGDG
jgi:thiosulfate reductase cytochrome b subunit